jgi:cell division septum initiation protein DivIVA
MEQEATQSINTFPYGKNEDPFVPLYRTFFSYKGQSETLADLQDRLTALEQENLDLKTEISSLRNELDTHADFFGRDLALMRQRMAAIEHKSRSGKTISHIEAIASHLADKRCSGLPPAMTYKEAAHVLGLTTKRIVQLKHLIEDDDRFIVDRKGKKVIIRLR